MFKAKINGVELTKEQLEEGLSQIKKAEEDAAEATKYRPKSGDYFTWHRKERYPDEYSTVYLAVSGSLLPNSETRLIPCVDKWGNMTHFGTRESQRGVVFVKVNGF